MMPDREKVLKGLECCQYSSKSHCDGCPYAYDAYDGLTGILDCTADLAEDTLALLKEQEQVIEELEHNLAITESNMNHYINGND